MRCDIGAEEKSILSRLLSIMATCSFLRVKIIHETVVLSIDVSNPETPLVFAGPSHQSGIYMKYKADLLSLVTGTYSTTPNIDLGVAQLTYCKPMNITHLSKFFSKKGLMNNDTLIPGARLLVGGTGLSLFDELTVIGKLCNFFEEDPSSPVGYSVTASSKQQYKNAITVVSSTRGKFVVPRHTFKHVPDHAGSPEWQQESPAIGDTEELHAFWLHQYGQCVSREWKVFMDCAVARATGRVPDSIYPENSNLSTKELAKVQYQETLIHMKHRAEAGRAGNNDALRMSLIKKASRTLYGARGQAASCTVNGYGFTFNTENTVQEMSKKAPLTWAGRQGWIMIRAQSKAISDPAYPGLKENQALHDNWMAYVRSIIASPPEIHSMFSLLVDAGIASHRVAKYEDIKVSSNSRSIILENDNFDAFVVSPVIKRNANPITSSLTRFGKSVDPHAPSYPCVQKCRQVVNYQDKTTTVRDFGLGASGKRVFLSGKPPYMVGAFSPGVEDRSSCEEYSVSYALLFGVEAHLRAAGVFQPDFELRKLVVEVQPSAIDFEKEVKRFAPYFRSAMEKHAYLKLITKVAGNDAVLFKTLYDQGFAKDDRKKSVRKLRSECGSSFI